MRRIGFAGKVSYKPYSFQIDRNEAARSARSAQKPDLVLGSIDHNGIASVRTIF